MPLVSDVNVAGSDVSLTNSRFAGETAARKRLEQAGSFMRIRTKIVLVVLPIVVAAIAVTGVAAFFSATTGITRIAAQHLDFKAEELERYARNQWLILEDNDLADQDAFVEATRLGIETYASGLLRSETESVVAFDADGEPVMSTPEIDIRESEQEAAAELVSERESSLVTVELEGTERVGRGFWFEPFNVYYLVTEARDTFYGEVNRIAVQTLGLLAAAIMLAVFFLVVFSRKLTGPLTRVASAMQQIIRTSDLDERVPVEYGDETGELAHTFNLMSAELDKAYTQIKNYAFQAVLAQKRESRIRNIFQKYVPQELIDQFYQNPESMLVGENRRLAVLFSDIRKFTTISEQLAPDDLVNSLNHYFSSMVDTIMNRDGVIDKYIGDAIMAFFGAPVSHGDNDVVNSIYAAVEMSEAADLFNKQQRAAGKPEFRIGIGLNYGEVTVGNIGSDRKMDYTVIGDMVNLASRIEGLTKTYNQRILVAGNMVQYIHGELPWRLVDTVAVKGKSRGVRICTVGRDLTSHEMQMWKRHNQAMKQYYGRDFASALKLFDAVLSEFPDDDLATMMRERCRHYLSNPPSQDWTGIEVMESK